MSSELGLKQFSTITCLALLLCLLLWTVRALHDTQVHSEHLFSVFFCLVYISQFFFFFLLRSKKKYKYITRYNNYTAKTVEYYDLHTSESLPLDLETATAHSQASKYSEEALNFLDPIKITAQT